MKQVIAATISQQTSDIIERLDGVDSRLDGVETKLGRLEAKVDSLSESVAEALNRSNQVTAEQFGDREKRIRRLEKKTA